MPSEFEPACRLSRGEAVARFGHHFAVTGDGDLAERLGEPIIASADGEAGAFAHLDRAAAWEQAASVLAQRHLLAVEEPKATLEALSLEEPEAAGDQLTGVADRILEVQAHLAKLGAEADKRPEPNFVSLPEAISLPPLLPIGHPVYLVTVTAVGPDVSGRRAEVSGRRFWPIPEDAAALGCDLVAVYDCSDGVASFQSWGGDISIPIGPCVGETGADYLFLDVDSGIAWQEEIGLRIQAMLSEPEE